MIIDADAHVEALFPAVHCGDFDGHLQQSNESGRQAGQADAGLFPSDLRLNRSERNG